MISFLFYLLLTASGQSNPCLKAIDLLSERMNVPKTLLTQIAKVESGIGSQRMPWPWSIHVQGKSYYFRTERLASLYIKQLLALGIENFDVGCLQINFYWHKGKVKTLDELLNPLKNTLIAAQFLKELKSQHQSWIKAVAYYHSSDPKKGLTYAKLVFTDSKNICKSCR